MRHRALHGMVRDHDRRELRKMCASVGNRGYAYSAQFCMALTTVDERKACASVGEVYTC